MRGRWLAVPGICLALLLAGCGEEALEDVRPPLVRVQRAEPGNSTGAGVYAGSVQGRYETDMSFQVGGQLLSRLVQTGDRVHAGDVLMTIDPRDAVQKAQQVDSQVESSRSQLELARKNLARYQQLYEAQAVPAAVLDQYRTSFEAALAAHEAALAQSAQAHNALSYTQLTAPADGVVSAVHAEAGQVLAAGQKVLTLVQMQELEVEIHVPENRRSDAVIGRSVRVSFWSLPFKVEGVVREVSPMADAVTRTYRVRVSLPEPPAGMELGMTASVSMADADGDVEGAALPLSAIYQTGDVAQVWVVQEETVHLQPVTVNLREGNSVFVQGVEPGTLVVTAGVHKLREGQSVRVGPAAP